MAFQGVIFSTLTGPKRTWGQAGKQRREGDCTGGDCHRLTKKLNQHQSPGHPTTLRGASWRHPTTTVSPRFNSEFSQPFLDHRSRPLHAETGPNQGAGKATGRVLGHRVLPVIPLFLQHPLALCTPHRAPAPGVGQVTATSQLEHKFSSAFPREP